MVSLILDSSPVLGPKEEHKFVLVRLFGLLGAERVAVGVWVVVCSGVPTLSLFDLPGSPEP